MTQQYLRAIGKAGLPALFPPQSNLDIGAVNHYDAALHKFDAPVKQC